jgi:hypothetical protein
MIKQVDEVLAKTNDDRIKMMLNHIKVTNQAPPPPQGAHKDGREKEVVLEGRLESAFETC